MLWGKKQWRTPDDAIRESTGRSILDARGIQYDRMRVDGSNDDQAVVLAAQTQVLAILGQFSERDELALKAYAHGFGYAAIARYLGIPESTVRYRHRRDRERVKGRLLELGLLEEEPVRRTAG